VPPRPFVVGSRGSRLAQRQTGLVLEAIRRVHPAAAFDLRTITTSGDASRANLSELGGRGVFVAEIERALLAGDIDMAVHSLKDMPSDDTDGLTVAAICERADVRDAIVSRDRSGLAALPAGAVVGTGSPRRAAQLLAARPDLHVEGIRGNVDTRVRKVRDGDCDAAVLAVAGLARLGLLDEAAEILSPEVMLPAAGQGAIAVQVRVGDATTIELVAAADHPPTHAATAAERAFEARLGAAAPDGLAGCYAAIAALAEPLPPLTLSLPVLSSVEGSKGARLRLRGLVAEPAGPRILRAETEGATDDPAALGVALAETLLARGAAELLAAAAKGAAR
jgi:hydroxymethylbilane synthase